jgi:VCBS repeat-containing protein
LWSSNGVLLAGGDFTSTTSTPPGWQEVLFSAPVAIAADATYVASYHAPAGHYSVSFDYFQPQTSAAFTRPPLRALVGGEDGPNGVYKYAPQRSFPTETHRDSNYWVDVVFDAAVNQAPVAVNDAHNTNEDTALTVQAPGILGNDTDDHGPLAAVVVDVPAHGSLVPNANGAFVYTPAPDFNGTDRFTYRASDGTLTSGVATVTIAVSPVNDAPVLAAIGNKSVTENALLAFTLAATDADGDTLSYSISGLPTGATFDAPSRTFTWTPTFAQSGAYPVTFTVTDTGTPVLTDSEAITITVTNVNRAPLAVNDAYTAGEDASLNVAAAGVIGNDTDADANPLTAVLGTGPSHGTLTLNTNGSFTYNPGANYNGADGFTYRANDGTADSNVATVSITVTGVNDAPTISDIANQTSSGTAVGPLGVTIGDVETAAAGLALSGASSNTTLVPVGNIVFGGANSARTVTITPAAGQSGSATITVTVSDGNAIASDTFVVTVTQATKTPTTTSTPTSTLTPSTYGQAVTFSATVSGTGGTPTGIVTFFDNGAPLGTGTLNASRLASLTTTAVNAGTRSITATYNGDAAFAASTSAAFTQTVNKAATTTTLTVTPTQRQYSDVVTFTATVSAPAAAQSASFRVGTVTVGTAAVDGTGKATLNAQLLGALGVGGKTVTVAFNNVSANYTVPAAAPRSITVQREDARVAYAGPASLCRCGGTTVTVTVNVRDISLADPSLGDLDGGDIGTATVAIINRGTGATLGTVNVVSNAADRRNGTATFTWTAPAGTYTLGFNVGNHYIRNNTADNAVVTVTN